MSREGLKCEFPEGCMLDLWARVIKAKYVARQVQILDTSFCVPEEQVGGKVCGVEDIKVKVINATSEILFHRVRLVVDYEVIMFVLVDGEYQIITVSDRYEQNIDLQEFDPPLTLEEFREEIEQSEVILKNWAFDFEIKGNCEDPSNPCNLTTPIVGTCIGLKVYVDIINKLGKMHDVIVYGEIEPEDYIIK